MGCTRKDRSASNVTRILGKETPIYIPLLEKLEEEVVNAPAAATQDDEDTSDSRQFNLWAQDRIFDEAKQVFIR